MSFLESQASSYVVLEHDNESTEYYSPLQND